MASRSTQVAGTCAVDLGGTRCHSALADLSGAVLAEDVRLTHSTGDAFSTLLEGIGLMRDEARRRGVPVEALAVGVPGILDPQDGVARDAPYLVWDGFPVVDRLAAAVEIPFVVDNDVNLAALAHAWRGDGRRIDHFVTLSVEPAPGPPWLRMAGCCKGATTRPARWATSWSVVSCWAGPSPRVWGHSRRLRRGRAGCPGTGTGCQG